MELRSETAREETTARMETGVSYRNGAMRRRRLEPWSSERASTRLAEMERSHGSEPRRCLECWPPHAQRHRSGEIRIPCSAQMLVKVTRAVAVGQANSWLDVRHRWRLTLYYRIAAFYSSQATLPKADAPLVGLGKIPKSI